ncbi:MAG: isochorismatase family protein [Ruminococcaceae bacterium]|nr:isochorismatase family protein [Oscillospiraceae bacterium]
MILLVLDAQIWLTNQDLYCYERFASGTKRLIEAARENNVEVIYVQHDNGPGTGFSKGDAEFEINQEFYPHEGEKRYVKTVSSAFQGTGLKEYLKDKNEDTVVIAGLLTNFCMDATIKSAFEMGLRVIVPEGTNTTFDNPYMDKEKTYKYYNEFMWPGRFAECISVEDTVQLMKSR